MMVDRDLVKPTKAKMKTQAIQEAPRSVGAVPSTGPALGVELQAHIGRQLRAVYDEVAHEPVPDRFLRLLDELERKQDPKS